MASTHGAFVWYELMTPDPDAAARFYDAVLGWETKAQPGAANGYRNFRAPDGEVAGMLPLAEDGPPPGWAAYIGVDDVDQAVRDIKAAGGTEHIPPTDIPGIGRFAYFADPQGAMFYAMQGSNFDNSTAFSPRAVGHCNWNELSTSDTEAALRFYGKLFGWKKEGGMPMGEMGDYEFLSHAGTTFGAQMRVRADGPSPRWFFYFGVSDIDRAHRALTESGGTVHWGPDPIPGDMFAVIGADPQGAAFGVVGPRIA